MRMQRTSRPASARSKKKQETPPNKKLANAAILGLGALVVAGVGLSVVQDQRVQAQNAAAVASYTPHSTDSSAPEDRVEVAFLGDSYTYGVGTSSPAKRWTTLIAKDQGWLEVNYGVGGTNFATAGDLKNGNPYTDRVDEIVNGSPDIVIVSSAGNDVDEDQSPGIRQTFTELREGLPDARIIATSPYYRAGDYPESLTAFGSEIREEVEAVDGEFLDIGHPLGDHPDAMADDKVHPNDAGHRLIADAVGNELG